jgi:hypothetical protein
MMVTGATVCHFSTKSAVSTMFIITFSYIHMNFHTCWKNGNKNCYVVECVMANYHLETMFFDGWIQRWPKYIQQYVNLTVFILIWWSCNSPEPIPIINNRIDNQQQILNSSPFPVTEVWTPLRCRQDGILMTGDARQTKSHLSSMVYKV